MREYPGYVYHAYPRMIYNSALPGGKKIVNNEEEENEAVTFGAPVVKEVVAEEAPKRRTRGSKKLMFDMEM